MKPAENTHIKATYLALSGGVGGAKLAVGLSHLLKQRLSVVTNTGDDFTHFGLKICPDLDTVMYTLADINNKKRGWGLADETWNFLDAMKTLGQESWFQLGDRDLATHISRTHLLEQGMSLSEATEYLTKKLGVESSIFPMSDQAIATHIGLKNGDWLPFQHYFVRERCEPQVSAFKFEGINEAQPSPQLKASLSDPSLAAVFICPSNPFVSVDPILSIPGLRKSLMDHPAPVIAVSPIVSGQAIKGPTAKMMSELNMPQTALAVAEHYGDLLDGYLLDEQDADLQPDVKNLGIKAHLAQTVMTSLEDKINLARECISFSEQLAGPKELAE